MMIKEVVREELGNIKQELEQLTSKPTQLSFADFFVTWYTYTTLKNI